MFNIINDNTIKQKDSNINDVFLLNRSGRYTALEGLRGIAVLMVFFVHFFSSYDNTEFLSGSSTALSVTVRFLHLGHIGVDFFFVLSGFFIAINLAKKKPAFLEFMTKRFLRLLPAHIAVLLVLIFKNQIANLYVILTNALFINIFLENSKVINIVTWSLGYEVVFYTLYGLWNIKLRKVKFLHSGYAFMLVFIIMWTAQWWGQPLVTALTDGAVKIPDMSRFIGFLFGIGIAKLYLSQKLQGQLSKLANICLLPAISSLIILQWHFEWGRGHKAIYFLLVGIAFSIVVASVLTKNKYLDYILDSKLLRFTGIISYSFYLIHPIAIGLTLGISTLVNKYISASLHLVLAIVLTYSISALMFLLLEKPYFTGRSSQKRV